jgi:hypothetical protein
MDDENKDGSMDKAAESDARKEALAEEADARIKSGAHWRDWMFVGDGIAVGQAKAMREANTNRPYGKAFTRAFGDWLSARSWAKRYDKGTRNTLLWCVDHRSEIEAWRETLAQSERDKMNHPTTVKRKFEATHKVADKDPSAAKKETKAEALATRNAELEAENAALKQQLKTSDGSLFNIRKDSPETIAKIIVDDMIVANSFTKAQRLRAALGKEIEAVKKRGQAG